ncbi:MAG: hypothetical protein RRZ73_04605 [Oscillospiraceae bacterium]
MQKDYPKQSYKLFVAWLAGFCVLVMLPALIPEKYISEDIIGKIVLAISMLAVLLLFYIVYKTERVYWINGTSYKDAAAATSEQRKAFAMKHLKMFCTATIIYLIYTVIAYAVKTNLLLDSMVFSAVTIIAAVKTISIKL